MRLTYRICLLPAVRSQNTRQELLEAGFIFREVRVDGSVCSEIRKRTHDSQGQDLGRQRAMAGFGSEDDGVSNFCLLLRRCVLYHSWADTNRLRTSFSILPPNSLRKCGLSSSGATSQYCAGPNMTTAPAQLGARNSHPPR